MWFVLALRYAVLAVLCAFFVALLLYLKHENLTEAKDAGPFLEVCASGMSSVDIGKRWYVGDSILIGRGLDCAVKLPDPYVSHHHARIFKAFDVYMVEDLRSKNGTFLNGRRVVAPEPLKKGDRLKIGETVVEFNFPKGHHKGLSSMMIYPGLILTAGGIALYLNGFILLHHLVILGIVAVFLSIVS
ncbi:MAG: FHA domain-containing protein, partial [Thermacetogeniaceae bacterium]